jgi:hypothetical protein
VHSNKNHLGESGAGRSAAAKKTESGAGRPVGYDPTTTHKVGGGAHPKCGERRKGWSKLASPPTATAHQNWEPPTPPTPLPPILTPGNSTLRPESGAGRSATTQQQPTKSAAAPTQNVASAEKVGQNWTAHPQAQPTKIGSLPPHPHRCRQKRRPATPRYAPNPGPAGRLRPKSAANAPSPVGRWWW